VAYIDFKRAFDSVSHVKLLTKLQSYGISGVCCAGLGIYLHCRPQQTRVGKSLSNITNFISGVIQGSFLGPLLFVISDVVQLFTDSTCTCKLQYAHDLKLYTLLHTIYVYSVSLWMVQKWDLSTPHTKYSVMYVGNTSYNVSMTLNDNTRSTIWVWSSIHINPLTPISAISVKLSRGPTYYLSP